MVEREHLPVPDAELSRPALVLAQRFVQRWDLHARQMDDGSHVCVHEQLNVGHLFAHLRGEITLSAYLLDQESQARFLILDADDEHCWEPYEYQNRSDPRIDQSPWQCIMNLFQGKAIGVG
jgi:hypothetical protein